MSLSTGASFWSSSSSSSCLTSRPSCSTFSILTSSETRKQIEQKAEKHGNKEALLQRKIQQRYGNEV